MDDVLEVKAFGTKGFMICIGPKGAKSGEWYFMGEAIKKQIDGNIVKGDLVTIKSEKKNDKFILLFINKAGAGATSSVAAKPSTGYVPRTPADNESIKRQAMGHMTSRILAGMCTSGMIPYENVEAEMEKIYKKFQTLVG